MKISFKDFILNENKYYLGNQIGDVLTAVQELEQNSEGMGTRQVLANSERILNQIRGILHNNWSEKEKKHLKDIQKVGVAIAKTIEEKDDLVQLLPKISAELQKISKDLGTPVNTIGTPSEDKEGDENSQNQ